MKRPLLLMLFTSVLLAACEAPPRTPRAEPAPAPGPAPVPQPPVEPPPAMPGPPASPEARQQADKLARSAAEILDAGNEDGARAELKRALALDSQNKLALSLTRQLTADPVTTLGREYVPYTVRPGETLAKLAQRQLGDQYLFYVLARYNDIKVPKQLSSGQVIRLPGKSLVKDAALPPIKPPPNTPPTQIATPPSQAASASPFVLPPQPPLPPPPPPPSPAEQAMSDGAAAERSGDLPRALAAYRKADALGQSGAAEKVGRIRGLLLARYTRDARDAFTKENLDGAIANWQRVLELDPGNTTAHSELERAKGLKVKLGGVK